MVAEAPQVGSKEVNDYPDYPNARKRFIPLENNPEVFTTLTHRLGLSHSFSFYDVYSIDTPELLAFIPRPSHALLFICPGDIINKCRAEEPTTPSEYTRSGDDEPVIWYKQTIENACGLIGLMHAVSNGETRNYVQPNSTIARLLHDAIPLEPRARADLLYLSQELEAAHSEAAHVGDTAAPDVREDVGYHFICFAKGKDGHLYELDGSWNGPIDRGTLAEDEDMLSARALDLGVRKMIAKAEGSVEFSLVALASSLD